MTSLRPHGPKDREQRHLLKYRGLVSEIKALWNREIPSGAEQAIPWLVLGAVINDLSPHLPLAARDELISVAGKRSVKGLMEAQALAAPQLYGDASSYFAASACLSLLKKYPWAEGEMNPEAKALERFWRAEKRCRDTNRRLLHFRKFDHATRPFVKRLRVHEVFHLARRKIQAWLGPVDLPAIFSYVRHGPGGCVGLRRPFSTPYYKFGEGTYTTSPGAYFDAVREIAKSDSWVRALAFDEGLTNWDHSVSCIPRETKLRLVDQRIEVVAYNEVTFVPKDAKTHRSIAIEPRVNVALQLSVGTFLKGVLKRAGCDLTDQTRNQELAQVGSAVSCDGDSYDPATLDLEMASDTLAMELVRELLPSDWYELLDRLRSREGLLQKKVIVKWEKFSSMGNGFTFELESMVFYALAQAVSDLDGTTEWFHDTFGPAYRYAYVSVFGDDIIVPKRLAGHLTEVLRYCGFRLNAEKSFVNGPFRESCGKDYFNGVPVRAFLLTRKLTRTRDLIHLRNGLKKLAFHRGVSFAETLKLVDSLLPTTLTGHLLGWTETDDDSYVWVTPDEAHQSRLVVYDRDLQSWRHPIMRETPVVHRGRMNWRYVQFLYSETGVAAPREEPSFYVHDDSFLSHRASGGSSGEVIRAGITRPVLRLAG